MTDSGWDSPGAYPPEPDDDDTRETFLAKYPEMEDVIDEIFPPDDI